MEFNDLLAQEKLNNEKVLVFRHRPKQKELRKVMPWLASEKPAVFNAYQRTQKRREENQIKKSEYVASFFGHEPGKAVFVGIYKHRGSQEMNATKLKKIPENQELAKYGFSYDKARPDTLWFDLALTKHIAKWKGKLIINWPTPEIVWSRWASKNVFDIHAILEESCFEKKIPEWRKLGFTWDELHVIPKTYRDALSQWRGIYFILDVSDGMGYVGSAYGSDNILGRWMGYKKTGHGGNTQLKKRDPRNFRFSIIERVSPDMPDKEVIQRENTWKERLHTREHGLNDN